MNNIIKILFAVILVFIAFLWISTILKSCNKPKSIIGNLPEQANENLPSDEFFDESDTLTDTISYFEDEINSDQKNIYDEIDRIAAERQNSESSNQNSSSNSSINQQDNLNEINETNPKANTNSNSTQKDQSPGNSNTAFSPSDKYMVITASFLLEKNADDAVQKLKKIGFSKAEKVVFDNSQYFSTLAGRTSTLKQAEDLLLRLRQNGYKDARVIEKK